MSNQTIRFSMGEIISFTFDYEDTRIEYNLMRPTKHNEFARHCVKVDRGGKHQLFQVLYPMFDYMIGDIEDWINGKPSIIEGKMREIDLIANRNS